MRRLLVISNGIGEDSVGAEIVKRLPKGTAVDAYPMIGDGAFYTSVCPVVGPRARVPDGVPGLVPRDDAPTPSASP